MSKVGFGSQTLIPVPSFLYFFFCLSFFLSAFMFLFLFLGFCLFVLFPEHQQNRQTALLIQPDFFGVERKGLSAAPSDALLHRLIAERSAKGSYDTMLARPREGRRIVSKIGHEGINRYYF